MRFSVFFAGVLIAFAPLAASAQDDVPGFPKREYFKQRWAPKAPAVELSTPVRLNDFVVDGKIELSLKNYMDLVLANNTDIQVTRLSVEPFRNAITRSMSVFDPLFIGRFQTTRSNTQPTDALAGTNTSATLSSLSQPWSFAYQRTFSTGAQYNLGFNGEKRSSNNGFAFYNPALTTNFAFNFTQPLMRNRGGFMTRLPISIARSRLKQNMFLLEDNIMRLIATAEVTYWNVVGERENLRVQEQALALSDAALKRAQRELELGASSPLDIFQPQAQYARSEIFVTQARYRLAQFEDQLRRQISIDLDPQLRTLPVVLTEPITAPTDAPDIDREETVSKAMRLRPDLKAANQAIDVDDLNIKGATNALLPNLLLGGGYQSTGRGGPFYQRINVFTDTGDQSSVTKVIPGGIGDAFSQLFNFNYPIYNLSLTLTLPLRDRRAAADLSDAVVSKKRDALTVRNTEQTVRLDVLNALNNVENSKASIKLAQIARDLAQKRVDAEQKKYELGTTTIFFVLAAQTDLTQAESDLVTQTINYRRNMLTLLQRTGELLQERGVIIQ